MDRPLQTPQDILEDPELSPYRSFGFRLWHVHHAWTRRVEALLTPLGLTHMQFVVMRFVDVMARQGAQPTQARLAQGMGVDAMLISKVVRLLEGKALLVRAVHPRDTRAFQLVLTEAGRQVLARALVVLMREQERYFGRLGPDRQRLLAGLLDEMLVLEGLPCGAEPKVTMVTNHENGSDA